MVKFVQWFFSEHKITKAAIKSVLVTADLTKIPKYFREN
jgi:hypothetical protein